MSKATFCKIIIDKIILYIRTMICPVFPVAEIMIKLAIFIIYSPIKKDKSKLSRERKYYVAIG